jgi:hypothetical protein
MSELEGGGLAQRFQVTVLISTLLFSITHFSTSATDVSLDKFGQVPSKFSTTGSGQMAGLITWGASAMLSRLCCTLEALWMST